METKDVIRTNRLRLGLTEQQLADRIGVSRGSIQQWEKGKTAPKRANQDAVAGALGITVVELMQPSFAAPRVRVNDGPHGYTLDARNPLSPSARHAALSLGHVLRGHDEVVREQASVLLKHLALQPDRAAEFADKLELLLGGASGEAPNMSQKAA